ncbi:hypothetical protein [Xylocopilactobacillus apicola]|uniref:Uncharacterized protein n=1 Tax=Xylocopilactobacillus apicola TaxID=2932184 RepID=A0AAU9D250_9LACO|nr:hypothetical protein [Xylocopilactobacillus apicola]BDR57789.1 hypothetical protein XA3_02300 [Xylocopilactobacillus apicola]
MTNDILPAENEVIEYKEFFNNKVKKEICAFLNGTEIAKIFLALMMKAEKLSKISALKIATKSKKL